MHSDHLTPMNIGRRFLDNSIPALPQVVAYLQAHFPPTNCWDLHDLTIAVPGARAVRRLTELLVEAAGEAGLLPPTIVTTGQLPEQLFKPTSPIASDLVGNLTWIEAAKATPELYILLPHQPEPTALAAWWSLAGQFRRVIADLTAARHLPNQLPDVCAGLSFALPEPERWLALAAVTDKHEALLEQSGLIEAHKARRLALESGLCRSLGPVLLVGVIDMTPLLADMLRAVDAGVTALIHADADLADAFDDLGAVLVEPWLERQIDITDERLRIVDRPFDQGHEAAAIIDQRAELSTDANRLSVEDITVGLGDEGDVDAIRRPLELSGLPVRFAAGRPMLQTPPALFLAALSQLAAHRRFRDLSDLLRHPDVGLWLHNATDDRTDWITILDEYCAEHLPAHISDEWLGYEPRAKRLEYLWGRISALLPSSPGATQPLPDWSEAILEALRRLYGARNFSREHEDQRATLRALERIAALIDEHQHLEPAASLTPIVTFAGAVELLLLRLDGASVPEDAGPASVELLGFLELALDDAPELIITGLNEGRIPAVRGPDPLLPDQLRQALGLDNNQRRYARAACALTTILQSRPSVTLISGRTTSDREPLLPSRLLLACDDETIARRLGSFYRASPESVAMTVPLPLLNPGAETGFFPSPPPVDDDTPLPTRLSVTGFRDYIACPYRFYLRRVKKLAAPSEPGEEMDGALFGTLAHDVLQIFGESDVATSRDPVAIEDCLVQALYQRAAIQFGDQPRPAITVQLDQLRLRLRHFALAQAELASQGWRIQVVELNGQAPFDVDGEPFTLSGRIDRIDIHPDRGIRIIDYKTSDTERSPEQTHRRARTEWLDLQLPLYRELARPLVLKGPVELAYFNLPRRQEKLGLSIAQWSPEEVDEAVEEARAIIRRIRNREFWPPGDPSQYGDEFVRLCADHALDRTELIELASRQHTSMAGQA
jgi:ATP-dependent helicase/nuclease subunit B